MRRVASHCVHNKSTWLLLSNKACIKKTVFRFGYLYYTYNQLKVMCMRWSFYYQHLRFCCCQTDNAAWQTRASGLVFHSFIHSHEVRRCGIETIFKWIFIEKSIQGDSLNYTFSLKNVIFYSERYNFTIQNILLIF